MGVIVTGRGQDVLGVLESVHIVPRSFYIPLDQDLDGAFSKVRCWGTGQQLNTVRFTRDVLDRGQVGM